MLSNNGKTDTEIQNRIKEAKQIKYTKNESILGNKKVKTKTDIMHNTIAVPSSMKPIDDRLLV